jgi:hypothetical protein
MLADFFHTPPAAPITNILQAARRPTFSGTESTAWSSPTLADAIKGLGGSADLQTTDVASLPAAMKRKVAALSLLGDPAADNARDLLFFPVVNPRTGKLNEGALRAVISGRGSQANIPEKAKASAQDAARRLLNSQFGAELDTNQAQCPDCGSFLPAGSDTAAGDEVECPQCGKMVVMQTDVDLRQALYGALAREMGEAVDQDVYHTPVQIQDLNIPAQTFTYRIGERLMQRHWKTDTTGLLTLDGDPQDVQSDTRYIPCPVTEEHTMPTDVVTQRVQALIANERTHWTELDRHWMEKLDEAALIRMEQAPLLPAARRQPETVQEAIATLPPHLQESMQAMSDEYDQRKTAAIQVLIATKRCPFAEEELQAMTAQRVEDLVTMAGASVPLRPGVQVVKDYSGRGAPVVRDIPEDEQVPEPPRTFARVVELQKAKGVIA